MSSPKIRHLAALVVSLALAASVPGAAMANAGGVPNANANANANAGGVPNANSKACPGKGKGNGPKKSAPNSKGKKCGFQKV